MADEETDEAEGNDAPKKDRGPLKLLGGALGLVVVGGALAMMAIPSKEAIKPRQQGPYFHKLFENTLISNVDESNYTRFIKTDPQIEFFSYDPDYVMSRDADLLYRAWLESEVTTLISSMKLDEIYNGVNRERFTQMVMEKVRPAVFPVHFGATTAPLQLDEMSGIRPGDSYRKASFRGNYHDHLLKVDALQKTLQVDNGPMTVYAGTEMDLLIRTPSGDSLYVDVTEILPEFVGEINVGVQGRIRQVFLSGHLAQ
ncbi:MAG: hypothetical protein ACI8QC_004114 [Planctomycetota bacterium]|jgi:hypothetical protein